LFADYATDLIGEMMNQLHVNSPADYESGISSKWESRFFIDMNKTTVYKKPISKTFFVL